MSPQYAAIITVSLPGQDKSATATLTLAPYDQVSVSGQSKRLQDCTLEELKQFADAWEADIWATYKDIKIIDLIADEQVDVGISADKQVSLNEWVQKAVIVSDAPTTTTELNTSTTITEEPTPNTTSTPAVEVEEIPIVDAAAEPPASLSNDEYVSPRITVAEPEPVHAEREAEENRELLMPTVWPSRARVRVAGQKLPSGSSTWQAVDILMDEPALRSAQAHALSSLNREVAGVLIGPPPEKQPDGRYVVHVIDTIVAKYTVMHGASVTYTPESWRYMNDKLAERYPDETAVMVGWYHTHPGFGIFLSGMDQFIHQNFFTQIWHIAYVLDPVARTSGFFCWDRQKSRVSRIDFAWPSWARDAW